MTNIILNTDSYKFSHGSLLPPNSTVVNSYIESRGGKWNNVLYFGLQAFVKEYLLKPITKEDIDEAEEVATMHGLPFHRDGWERILNKWNGFLPIEIEALPEGTVTTVSNALVQVRNTDPALPWLTSFIETALLRAVWYPTTVATLSWHVKHLLKDYMDKSSDNPEGIVFKLHDFGARGVSSDESAGLGGAGHLVNFMGTDTVSALLVARKYYGEKMAGYSIPATEHSVMSSWGGRDGEVNAMENFLNQYSKPNAIIACVSDTYDLWNAVDNYWGGKFKERIEKSGSTLVVRPDSGNPTIVPIQTILKLMDKFGFTVNSKGYKVLPNCIRVIQGDGITIDSIVNILENMEEHKLSLDNLAFGMGGGLLQQVNRDTLKFAMKASAIEVDGEWRDVFKDPITDNGKRSKKGILSVIKVNGNYETIRRSELKGRKDELITIYRNGKLFNETTFAKVRELSNA